MTVTDIQRALNALGAQPPLALDGRSGARTRAAIARFQQVHGLAVDGLAGPVTAAAIAAALEASVSPPPKPRAAYCRLGYGLGGAATSPGIDALWAKAKAQYPALILPPPFAGGEEGEVVQDVLAQPAAMPIILGGYSWDADNTTLIARAVYPRPVAFLWAIQPSVYYPTVPIEDNVVEAECVYNPQWLATFGLGYQRLALAPGNRVTKFRLVETADTHPAVQWDETYWNDFLAGIGRILDA